MPLELWKVDPTLSLEILALQELCGLGFAQSQSPGFVSHLEDKGLAPSPLGCWSEGIQVRGNTEALGDLQSQ